MILEKWNQFSELPLGRQFFSKALGYFIPYTGSIKPEVIELKPGYAKIRVRDRRSIRNHLQSIHAAALMNMAEAASGLSFVAGLPEDAMAILVKFTIEYIKKGRGDLFAECHCVPPTTSQEQRFVIESMVKNAAGELIAKAEATWLVSPKRKTK